MTRRSALFAPMIGAAFVAATTAHAQSSAGWVSIYAFPTDGTVLPDMCRTAFLNASDNRPLVAAAGSLSIIEVFGHGIDLGSALPVIEGVSGEEISFVKRYNGAQNATQRGCGPIGSIKMDVKLPDTLTTDVDAALRIGTGVRVPMRIVTRQRLTAADWSSINLRRESRAEQAGSPLPTPPPPPPPPSTNCTAVTNCTSVVYLGPSGSTGVSSGPTFERPVLSCIADLAGSAARISGADLFLTLPDLRASAAARGCFERNLPIRVSRNYAASVGTVHLTARFGEGIIVELPNVAGGTLRAFSSTPRTLTVPEDRAVNIVLGSALGRAIVGQVRMPIIVRNPSGGQTRTLNLIVQSATGFGVERLELNPLTKPAVRFNTDLTGSRAIGALTGTVTNRAAVRFHLFPTESLGDYHWVLEPLGQGNPARCFTQTTGTFRPTAVSERIVDVSLLRTGAAGCAGTSVQLVAWSGPISNKQILLYNRTLTIPAS
ncbi:hypothetical protein [Novosphingobium sp. Chol11]|uniref:hypothetical protein n=1 Tax=Novosphingobium sp. Chol11 TaxID=1385763 RepID=UPI0025F5F855|nr:hypothetical protein [Novosphingobium sp. Chol11]